MHYPNTPSVRLVCEMEETTGVTLFLLSNVIAWNLQLYRF